jgi:SAM-dependent methyltransferase
VTADAGNPVALLLRHVVQARLEALFRRGDRVLDLGGGRGADALFLASRGVRVVGLDPSREAIEAAATVGGRFDGAYASSGLDGADLSALGSALAVALRPGAPVLLSLRGPRPLPGTLRRALTGLGEPRPACPTLAQARRALGPALRWTDAYALGVLLPAPENGAWAAEHAQAFGILAALERAVRHWPLLRQLGDRAVLEGRRADGP